MYIYVGLSVVLNAEKINVLLFPVMAFVFSDCVIFSVVFYCKWCEPVFEKCWLNTAMHVLFTCYISYMSIALDRTHVLLRQSSSAYWRAEERQRETVYTENECRLLQILDLTIVIKLSSAQSNTLWKDPEISLTVSNGHSWHLFSTWRLKKNAIKFYRGIKSSKKPNNPACL